MMRSTVLFYVLCSLLLSATACKSQTETEQTSLESTLEDERIYITQAQFDSNNFQLGKLDQMAFPEVIEVTGMIDVPPQNKVIISAVMGGYVKDTPLIIGDKVQKGQRVLTLENPEFIALQQEFLEVKGQLGYLKAEYERQQKLLAENITSKKSYLKAESDYNTAIAKYSGLRKQLQLLHINPNTVSSETISSTAGIYSPIEGVVSKVEVNKGSYVTPTSEMLEIIDDEHIHIELMVFEKDINKIKKNQVIRFKTPEASEKTFKGNVYLVGNALSENRTITVHGHIDDAEDHDLKVGMFVEGEIELSDSIQQSSNVLPESAVIEGNGQYFVLVLDEKKEGQFIFRQEVVHLIARKEGYIAIRKSDAFSQEDQIIIQGALGLVNVE